MMPNASIVFSSSILALAACGSAPTKPGDGPPPDRDTRLADPTVLYSALFSPGASARYKIVDERSSVTPEAAERGGPESDADWEHTTSEGEITCRVVGVRDVGAQRVSEVTCEGYEFSQVVSPIGGLWISGPSGLHHVYGDARDDAEIADFIADQAALLLPVPAAGRRATDELELVTTAEADGRMCVDETYLMGDDGGSRFCFVPRGWPDQVSASGGAAWMTSTIRLSLLK